jgi:ketosteroid isomerase-like protein
MWPVQRLDFEEGAVRSRRCVRVLPELRFLTTALFGLALCGCSAAESGFDQAQRELVVAEVQQRLDDYATAVTSRDIDAILSFWSDSLVFAGGGSILGGYEEWAPIARQDNELAQQWMHWTWDNVHILPLSPDAASATLEFEYEKILAAGDTVTGYGSWTYVLKKGPDGWQVHHGNGHHPVH